MIMILLLTSIDIYTQYYADGEEEPAVIVEEGESEAPEELDDGLEKTVS